MFDKYDVAIIGSGPGGYVAAIRAAQLGFKTVCIEKNAAFGGTCLNVGCIPSKTLLHATEVLLHLQEKGKEQGIEYSNLHVNFSQLTAHKKLVVKELVAGISGLFQKNHIASIQGEGQFVDPHRIRILQSDGVVSEIEAINIVIATGSEPISLPNFPFDERQIVSSTGALFLSQVPERLFVVGAGVIGVELASVYQRLGSQVTIIEILDHICPAIDKHLTKSLLQMLKKQGIKFMLSSRLISAVLQPNEVILTIESEGKIQNESATVLLVAVGRRPYTKGLQLEKIGIQVDKKGFIPVDKNFRTIHSHIFAIGDVIEGTMLAHRSSAEGAAVIEFIAEIGSRIDYLSIPNIIYTYPEVAVVGLTEEEARASGINVLVGSSFFRGNPRARCTSETEGVVKIIGDKASGRLLGMHILGPHASELISEGMIAMQKGLLLSDIAEAVQAHPTLSEIIKEAALTALGRPIHH